jgi:NAD(P)-dependent dehydrogenase (short-subunit alcohol dehydrogenase family)
MASSYERTPFKTLGTKNWQDNMEINLRSTYLLCLQAAPLMKQQGEGRIINFSDWIAASARPRYKEYLPYYVSKMGIIGLTEALALELAPEILVNTIAPGPILAPPGLSEKESQEVQRNTPLKRWGGSIEIAKAVLFLIETDFFTGECIRVDGGRHLY